MGGERLLLALLAVLCLFLAAGWWWSAREAGRRSRARLRRARAGEEEAERLLAEAGYEVLDRQVSAWGLFVVDGEEREYALRADLWVGRGDRRYVAEVKTGDEAPDPALPATRRQLLEYQIVFAPDGLLLVDVEAGEIRAVVFPDLAPGPRR